MAVLVLHLPVVQLENEPTIPTWVFIGRFVGLAYRIEPRWLERRIFARTVAANGSNCLCSETSRGMKRNHVVRHATRAHPAVGDHSGRNRR